MSPWLPGVAIGHNDRIAWGMAAFPADTQDVFIERLNPSNPHQVESRGRFVDTVIVKDPIVVKGRPKPFDFEREYTPNGVVIASDRARHLAFTVRWSGMEAGARRRAGRARGRSRAVGGGSAGRRSRRGGCRLSRSSTPMPTATVGRQVAGLVPIRSSWDGAVPAPGWSGAFDWHGWRKLNELPHDDGREAARHVAIAANQNVARTNRLVEILDNDRKFTVDDLKTSAARHDVVERGATRAASRARASGPRRPRGGTPPADRVGQARDAPTRRLRRCMSTWEEALLRKLTERRVAHAVARRLSRPRASGCDDSDQAVARVV